MHGVLKEYNGNSILNMSHAAAKAIIAQAYLAMNPLFMHILTLLPSWKMASAYGSTLQT